MNKIHQRAKVQSDIHRIRNGEMKLSDLADQELTDMWHEAARAALNDRSPAQIEEIFRAEIERRSADKNGAAASRHAERALRANWVTAAAAVVSILFSLGAFLNSCRGRG